MKAAVLTVSEGVHEGTREDASGEVLTALSAFWFARLAHITPHHLVTTNVNQMPEAIHASAELLRGRSMLDGALGSGYASLREELSTTTGSAITITTGSPRRRLLPLAGSTT